MSSATEIRVLPRAASAGLAVLLALLLLAASAGETDAKKKRGKKSGSISQKLPSVTRVDPTSVAIGDKLTISGKNFVKGKKKMRVLLQRTGSKRRFTVVGTATSTKSMSIKVPNVTADLPTTMSVTNTGTIITTPQPAIYQLRLISKYGMGKLSKVGVSPTINPATALDGTGAGDCDADGIPNSTETDDDNDLLTDSEEQTIGTDPCLVDTDSDGPSDYYEYRVAFEFNGGPVLPYPGRAPYPNPLYPDSTIDFDGDGLVLFEEHDAWMMTGRMDRFYSDANQDSDADGVTDDEEDEDADLMMNWVELRQFLEPFPLAWLIQDTDGDGLCDGLDDQEHDGPPTSLAVADCATPVPNNGPADTPAGTGAGDPGPLIDGDDNIYSNWYEWFTGTNYEWFNPCLPSVYPVSPYCPHLPPHDG